ncbi:GNAT family acetyltransferase [Synechococcus sp. 1G10]|uniref:GNAT family acetyltransferase n=1 Tax=Synechococcus sp. 1G10 TaxID=2025605 RepID=UPI000B9978BB|nr:GNAT family acetyltransferase [Synechococcus sp. 1G10]
MIPFRSQPPAPRLPEGYRTEAEPPQPGELNILLMACGESQRDEQRLVLVLERSAWQLCVRDPQGRLVGFVRATSDQALNANLWDLSAWPADPHRSTVLAVLVHGALSRLRRELSGCSISVAAPPEALSALQQHGFMVDPGGIRAMGLVLTTAERETQGAE